MELRLLEALDEALADHNDYTARWAVQAPVLTCPFAGLD